MDARVPSNFDGGALLQRAGGLATYAECVAVRGSPQKRARKNPSVTVDVPVPGCMRADWNTQKNGSAQGECACANVPA